METILSIQIDLDMDIFNLLLEKKDSYIITILEGLDREQRKEIVTSKKGGNSKVFLASSFKLFKLVRYFLKECLAEAEEVGIIKSRFCSALWIAVFNNDLPMTTLLIQHGANVNNKSSFGESPLLMACKSQNIEIVKLLCDANANVNSLSDSGDFCLQYCNGAVELAQILLDSGVDVNIVDKQNRSALWYAIKNDCYELACLLIDNGADLTAKDGNGSSILEFAALNCREDIVMHILMTSSLSQDVAASSLELLGACIGVKENDLVKITKYWVKALIQRFNCHPNTIHNQKKEDEIIIKILGKEFTTVKEIGNALKDKDATKCQIWLILLRTLGTENLLAWEQIFTNFGPNETFNIGIKLSLLCEYTMNLGMNSSHFGMLFSSLKGFQLSARSLRKKNTDCDMVTFLKSKRTTAVLIFVLELSGYMRQHYRWHAEYTATYLWTVLDYLMLVDIYQCPRDVLKDLQFAFRKFFVHDIRWGTQNTFLQMCLISTAPHHIIEMVLECKPRLNEVDLYGSSALHTLLECPDEYIQVILPSMFYRGAKLNHTNSNGVCCLTKIKAKGFLSLCTS